MTDTNTLLDLKTVRVRRYDRLNVVVEILTDKPAGTFRNPSTGEPIEKPNRQEWEFDGYFSNVKSALQHIYDNDLMMDDRARTLDEYITDSRRILSKLRQSL